MNDPKISSIASREVLDSKGRPMVEVDVRTNTGALGRGSFPCGTSVGSHEAHVLRDNENRFGGQGVRKAVRNVTEIILPSLAGKRVTQQQKIDNLLIELDGTPNKSCLGANAIYSVSIAVARAAANALSLPLYRYLGGENASTLPIPMFNVINGGVYGAINMEFQEFLLVPTAADSYAEALRMAVEVFYQLDGVIREQFGEAHLRTGHSAGYAAPTNDPATVIETLLTAVEKAGYKGRFRIGLDCAASHFYNRAEAYYAFRGNKRTQEEMIRYLEELSHSYAIFVIEDPLGEDDFPGFAEITKRLNLLISGDDLFVTNVERLKQGIRLGAANALVLKPNMIGTITESLETVRWAQEHGYVLIPSIRSCSGVDDPIPDIAIAVGAPLMKPGAPRSGERTACHNRLLRIEEELEGASRYPSFEALEHRVVT